MRLLIIFNVFMVVRALQGFKNLGGLKQKSSKPLLHEKELPFLLATHYGHF